MFQRPRPYRLRRQMVGVQIGQLGGQRIRIGAVQAGAAEHQLNAIMEDIGGDALPKQLHHRARAVSLRGTGPPKLEQLA